MQENDDVVFIIGGAICNECLGPIESQEDHPVVFNCEAGGAPHIYHEDCLPVELARILMVKRTAAMN